MQMPRPRFTIAGFMMMVLLAGLSIWGVITYQKLRTPSINEIQALAAYQQATLVREVAEYALKEYREGIYQQDEATYNGMIALAKFDLDRAIDRRELSQQRADLGQLSSRTRDAFFRESVDDLLTQSKAEFDLEQAKTQLEVLENYTKGKQLKSLTGDIAKDQADEFTKRETYRLERS